MTTYALNSHAAIKQLLDAGMNPQQAEAVVPAMTRTDAELATKQNLAVPNADLWRIGASIAGAAVLLNKFLDRMIL